MMNKNVLTGVMVAIFSLFTVTGLQAQAQSAGNISAAYVDMGRVLQEDDNYQEAMQDLKNYRNNLQKRIKKQRKDLQKMRKDLKDQQSLLSKKQKQKRQQKIARKMQQLQQRAQRSKGLMQQKQQELLQPVLEKINPVVQNVAKEKGFNAVYSFGQRNNTSVLWVSQDLDITDAVIERLKNVDN